MAARFPWDLLKAESLRAVSRDLGGLPGRRDEMITFLKAVEEQGLEEALEMEAKTALEQKPPQMAVSPAVTPGTPGLKRSRQPVVSDYNTRHRDKRARVSDPGPGSRRKAGRKPNGPIEAAVYSPKQPKSKAALMTGPAIKGRRTIFDGVVLPRFVPSAEKGKDKTDVVVSNGVPPAEQGEENGAADQPLEGLEDLRVESSLASSNKENEHESPSQASVNEAGVTPGDATGSPLSQRVLENIVEAAAPVADEDLDAEGEMVAEHEHEPEVAERQHAPLIAQAEIAQQSPGDGTQAEQTVTLAVENGHAL